MPEQTIRPLTYAAALREALDQSMAADPKVIVIGEGVPDPKAIFGTTAGLQEKYGSHRVYDMPLAENGLTGICTGAAMTGLRPVMVHQRIDFALLAMDQIVNNAAKWHYMFGGKASIPLVVRMIIGRGWGQGPQHSQGFHPMFAQVPGLKVVMPATPFDAKGMLVAAIEDNNPVMFIEHRWLHNVIDTVPEELFRIPLDKARLMREGDAVTVAAFSYMAMESLHAARLLSESLDIELDVIDMRSARPLDIDTVVQSVKKTGRLLVADPTFRTGSLAGELITAVTERAFGRLRSAPQRITLPDYPVPTSHHMTQDYYPDAKVIADAVIDMVGGERQGSVYADLVRSLQKKGWHDVPFIDFSGPF
jgi:pyruvate/2-oxoglutarate/acetoin dehydrogenase E1 component